MLFENHEFFESFQTVLQTFLQLSEVAAHRFSGISKKILKKNSMMKSGFVNVAKRRI